MKIRDKYPINGYDLFREDLMNIKASHKKQDVLGRNCFLACRIEKEW